MRATPEGFTMVPGTERVTATAVVLDVTRDGAGDRVFVCKRLGARAFEEPWVRVRLAAEGELLRKLDGRGTPRLVASGEDAQGPWLVMERVAGKPLGAYLGVADASFVAKAAARAFEALAGLHDAGVVHADLNPDNVLVTDDAGAATILDFGLARWPGAPRMPDGPFRGTLAYAAPEVARGEPFDARADLFAMAATLLHVASGEPPRPQETPGSMLLAAGEAGIEEWAARAARKLSAGAGAALARCCAFEVGSRPATATDVVAALAGVHLPAGGFGRSGAAPPN